MVRPPYGCTPTSIARDHVRKGLACGIFKCAYNHLPLPAWALSLCSFPSHLHYTFHGLSFSLQVLRRADLMRRNRIRRVAPSKSRRCQGRSCCEQPVHQTCVSLNFLDHCDQSKVEQTDSPRFRVFDESFAPFDLRITKQDSFVLKRTT